MAIPLQSLSGSEVLRRGCINAQSNTNTTLKFDNTATTTAGHQSSSVPANHIVTVLNVIFCEQGNQSNELLTMWVEGVHASGIYLLRSQPIGAYETFVWNEKIVLIGGDQLRIETAAAANIDIYYSYIDQSWV